MSRLDTETPLPPLWLQHQTLEKLSSGNPTCFVSGSHQGTFCISYTDEHLICARVPPEETSSGQLEIRGKVELPENDAVVCVSAMFWKDTLQVVTSHRSSLLRQWTGPDLQLAASFKAQHLGPTILMEFGLISGTLFTASSSGDMSIKAWNLGQQQCLQTFRPVTSRPMVLKAFQKESFEDVEYVAAGTVEGNILVWKQGQGSGDEKAVNLQKHVSPVSCLAYSHERLISGGRDQILIVWDTNKWEPLKVVPTFQNLNVMTMLSDELKLAFKVPNVSHDVIVTGSQEGKLRVWNVNDFREIQNEKAADWSLDTIPVSRLHCMKESLFFQQEDVIARAGFEESSSCRHFSLNEFEVTDMAVVAEKYLVVSTSSPILRCYNLDDKDLSLNVARTEDEVTLALAGCKKNRLFFCSSGRNKSIRIWKISKKKSHEMKLLTTLSGHTGSVKGLIMLDKFVFSGDQDGVLKLWSMDDKMKSGSTINTKICHDKEITCMDIQTSRGLIATGSLTKEVKLWDMEHLNQVATLSGHRRGISCVTFSTHDHAVASGSSDAVVKIWHTNTYTCLQTIEGISGAPTKCLFLSRQSIAVVNSSGNLSFHDCLVGSKEKAAVVFEGHEDHVWSLLERNGELITAGKDGKITFWKDNQEQVELEKARRREKAIQFEQALANCESSGNIVKAVNLSLKLDKPQHAYRHLAQAYQDQNLEKVLAQVKKNFLPRLMDYAKRWNTVSRQVVVAQMVQNFVLARNLLPNLNTQDLQGLLMYNEKHLARLSSMYDKLAIVDHLLQE